MAFNFAALASGFAKRQVEIRKENRDIEEQRRAGIQKDFLRLLADPATDETVKGQVSDELSKLLQTPLEDSKGFVKEYKYNPSILLPQSHKTPTQVQQDKAKAQQAQMPDPTQMKLGEILGPVLQAHAAQQGQDTGSLQSPMPGGGGGGGFQIPAPMMGGATAAPAAGPQPQGPIVPPPQDRSMPAPPPIALAPIPGTPAFDMRSAGPGAGPGPSAGPAAPVVQPPPGSDSELPPGYVSPNRLSADEVARRQAVRQHEAEKIGTAIDIPQIPAGMSYLDFIKSGGASGQPAQVVDFLKGMASTEVQQALVRQQMIDRELGQVKDVNLLGYKTPQDAVQNMKLAYPIAAQSPGFEGFVIGRYAQQKEEKGLRDEARSINNEYKQTMQEARMRQMQIEADTVAQNSQALRSGLLSPLNVSPRSPIGARIIADATKNGYDFKTAFQDATAVQRFLNSVNGNTQLVARQNVYRTRHSLELLRKLNDEWNAGGFPLLNAAKLKVAQSGAMGPQAQSIAARFPAQIADLTNELASVFSGGYAATDDRLKLAAENLKSKDWGKKTMNDLINLADQNLSIRENSFSTATPMGINGPIGSNNVVQPPPNSGPPGASPGFTITAQR